jgi:branched-chain amino acid aminotransferase
MNAVPEHIWLNGEVVPWERATVHISSEVATRGANVFEGIRAYWLDGTGQYAVVAPREHLRRLMRSLRLLSLPCPFDEGELMAGIGEIAATMRPGDHLYLRPTVYVSRLSRTAGGQTGGEAGVATGAYITAYDVPLPSGEPIACIISSWQRPSDLVWPALVKAGAPYFGLRLAKLEAINRGADDAILLNSHGLVAEAAGSAVVVVKDGTVYSPPASDGALDSITRAMIGRMLAVEYGGRLIEKSLSKSELYGADEVFLCGTLEQIVPVGSIDSIKIGDGGTGELTKKIQDSYTAACLAAPGHHGWLSREDLA